MRKLINAEIECNFARAAAQRSCLGQNLIAVLVPSILRFTVCQCAVSPIAMKPHVCTWLALLLVNVQLRSTRGRGQGIASMARYLFSDAADILSQEFTSLVTWPGFQFFYLRLENLF